MDYDLQRGLYPYPLSMLKSDGGNVTDLFTLGDPSVAPASNNWYVLCLTPEQLLKFGSSLAAGAPLAYPDTYNEVLALFAQAREFPNEVEPNSCMNICELVLECIQTNPDVINSLIDIFNYLNESHGDSQISQTILDTDTLSGQGIVACELDNLFGAVTGIVDLIDTLAVDLIQLIVAALGTPARIGDLIEAIPIIGELPFDDLPQFLEGYLTDLSDNYDAVFTSVLRDEYRCDLFCIAQQNCAITFDDISEYFRARIELNLFGLSAIELIGQYILGNFTGTEIVDAWFFLVSGLILYGERILDTDAGRFVTMVSALFNDPDSDHTVLCDPCTICPAIDWTYVWDFTVNNGQFSACDANGSFNNGYGLYTAGVGWGSTDVTNKKHTVYLRSKDMTPVTDGILEYEVFWTIIPDGAASAAFREPDTTNWQYGENWDGNPPPVLSRRWDFCAAKDGQIDNILRLLSFQQNDVTNDRYLGYITKIKIYGTGANPTGFLGGSFE